MFSYTVIVLLMVLAVLRVMYVLYNIWNSNCSLKVKGSNLKTILCIGSGGHTTEMLKISKNLSKKYSPRLYIMADSDSISEAKILWQEVRKSDYVLGKIPRSRNVGQSFISSIFSTLYATCFTFPKVYNFKPDVIFCNGPGTCIPICMVAFLLRCMFLLDCRIVFIESICRVTTLSLSGKILLYFADLFIVQWPELKSKVSRSMYFGRLS